MQLLLQALGSFDLCPSMVSELLCIIAGSGYELRFLKLFLARLEYLSRLGVHAIAHEEFENLGNGLFSMHLSGQGFNIRILFSFLPNADPSLLLCFYERGGKRKTNYTPYIEPAMNRFKERMEVYQNGTN